MFSLAASPFPSRCPSDQHAAALKVTVEEASKESFPEDNVEITAKKDESDDKNDDESTEIINFESNVKISDD